MNLIEKHFVENEEAITRSLLFTARYVHPFESVQRIFDKTGWIVWRFGTGGNIELLHIKTEEKGRGYGRSLVYQMLEKLREFPPYYSIFGFTRVSNEEAQAFYGALGFELQEINGVYKDGRAILFWQSYETLLKLKEEYESSHQGQ